MPPASSSSSSRVKDEGRPSPLSSSSRAKGKSSSGQLTANEKRVWQAVYDAPNHSMTLAKIERQFTDLTVEKTSAIVNSLTAKSMLSMQVLNGKLHQFIAATRAEASIIGQLEEIESMVYSHIRDCGNEGIWTKNLKQRTNVHQTSLTRVLKALEGKNLIKAVKSVKFPTRKIYMLYNLQPSVELSGGPWYTDNELDTAFINQLCNVLHKYIASVTWPPRRHAGEDDRDRPIFPASHIHNLPSATQCRDWLSRMQVTSTNLSASNIESLLDVLVYDGKIDKIPFARVESSAATKNRKRRDSDEWTNKSKRDGYESQSDESEIAVLSGFESSEESETSRKKRKRRASKQSEGRKKGKDSYSTSERRIKRSDDEEESDDDDNGEDVEEEGAAQRGAIVSSFVYRALRDIHIEPGWTEVPCAHCPVFDFCSPGGPVNAEGCFYMREWIPRNKSTQARRMLDEGLNDAGEIEVDYEQDQHMTNGGATSGEEDNQASLGAPSSPNAGQEDVDDDDYGGEEV